MAQNQKQQSKTERAQALMREQQRKERTRNLAVVGVIVVAVIVIIAVVFVTVSKKDTSGQAAKAVPANLSGPYTVTLGKSTAKNTIVAYEDLQCPICKEFEAVTSKQVDAAIAAGTVKVEYHMVAFLDRESSTNYSSRALNAAAAVLDTAGPDIFLKFHNLLYDNQPAEGSAGLTDSQLIQYAVQAGADQAKVTPLINGNVYHQWVVNATNQMSLDKVTGTPTVYVNGKELTSPQAAAQAVIAVTKPTR